MACMTQKQQPSELELLRWDWSEAYSITTINSDYCAVRRDNDPTADVMRATTVADLRKLIVADYSRKPISRDFDEVAADD